MINLVERRKIIKMGKAGKSIGKQLKISKAQQVTLAIVMVTALALGASLVLGRWMIKTIDFNAKVLDARGKAIIDYEKTLKNIGVCVDKDRDGEYSEEELKNCKPNKIKASEVKDALKGKIMNEVANNKELESVGRESLKECFDKDGKKIDFNERAIGVDKEAERNYYLDMNRMCSALRVIPEAMPASRNEEALMSSLNQIFIASSWEPESLSPDGSVGSKEVKGLGVIPVRLSVESTPEATRRVLANIEKSIRLFDIQKATISWSGSGKLSLSAQAKAYHTVPSALTEKRETIYASKKAENQKKTSRSKK